MTPADPGPGGDRVEGLRRELLDLELLEHRIGDPARHLLLHRRVLRQRCHDGQVPRLVEQRGPRPVGQGRQRRQQGRDEEEHHGPRPPAASGATRPRRGRGSHPLRQGLGGGDLGPQSLELGAFVAGEVTRGRRRRVHGQLGRVPGPGLGHGRRLGSVARAVASGVGFGVGRSGVGSDSGAVARRGGSAWGWARWACCSWSSSSGGPVRHPDAVGRGGPRQAPRQFPTVGRFGWRLVTQRG